MRSLYDAFGPGYTLLRFDATANVSALVAAAEARNMPLSVLDLDLDAAEVPTAYPYKLVLCRADEHVVWRGHEIAVDPEKLVAMLCGAVPAAAH